MKQRLRVIWLLLATVTSACSIGIKPPLSSPSLAEIATLGPNIKSIAFSPRTTESGTLLAVTTYSAVELWDVTPLTATQRITLPYSTLSQLMPDTDLSPDPWYRDAPLVAFSPDGAILAIGGTPDTCAPHTFMRVTPCRRGVVYRWDVQSGKLLDPWEIKSEEDANGGPVKLQFGPNGKELAFLFNLNGGSESRSENFVAVWNTQTGLAQIHAARGGGKAFLDIAFSSNGKSFAINSLLFPCYGFNSNACPADTTIIQTALMEPLSSSEQVSFTYTLPYSGRIYYSSQLAFMPDGNSLITSIQPYHYAISNTTLVYVHDLQTFQQRAQYSLKGAPLRSIVLSPDGQLLIVGDDEGQVRFLELDNRTELTAVNVGLSSIDRLALSGDGRLLAAVGKDGMARILELTLK